MGFEGLVNLMKFVQEGGLLITEGSTSTIFPDYHVVQGITIEEPQGLFARGVVMKGVFADRKSPIAYGYDADALPIYFSSGPVLNVGGGGAGWRRRAGRAGHPGRRPEPDAQRDRANTGNARRPSAAGGGRWARR